MNPLGKIIHPADAAVSMDEQELVRQYVQTDKITFGVSRLKPGEVGGLDSGHASADEVFYCMKGHVLVYFPEDKHWYELQKEDALLIPPGTGHKIYNIGDEEAEVSWSCAPHP